MPGYLRSRLALSLIGALLVSFSQLAVVGTIAMLGATLSSPDSVGLSGRLDFLRAWLPPEVFATPQGLLVFFALLSACAVVGNNVLRAGYAYWAVRVSKMIEAHYAREIMDGLLRIDYEWHTGKKKSDVMSIQGWTNYYGAASSNIILLVCDALSVLLVGAGVVAVEPLVGGGCLLGVSVVGYGLAAGSKRWLATVADDQRKWAIKKARLVYLALMGVRDIKLFGQEAPMMEQYHDHMLKGVQVNSKLELVKPMPTYLLETLGFVAISLGVVFMVRQGASTAYMAGTMALIAAAGWRLLPTVGKMLNSINMIRVTLPYIRKVEEYFADTADRREALRPDGRQPAPAFTRELRMRDIGFTYQAAKRPALTGIDLDIPKGGVVGVVGSSGSGKSTLMDVLCGLFAAGNGRLEIDGLSMDAGRTRQWQVDNVGYVSQAPFIFNGTLAENIAFSLEPRAIDRDRILESCRMAAVDFLDDLPKGVDSPIGDAGILLSGGQKQRVAIARALYRDPQVLIFDEATSSLDTKSEAAIQETILGLRGSRTLIIVAHRLSTVEACDKVYWIDKGRLRMAGSAAEVLPVYRGHLNDQDAAEETLSANG